MKTSLKALLAVTCFLYVYSTKSIAQIKIITTDADLQINDGSLMFRPSKYVHSLDSLAMILKKSPTDTAALFEHSFFLYRTNNVMAKPHPNAASLANLKKASAEADSAYKHSMKDFKLKILRARIFTSLANQYLSDESWTFKPDQIRIRRNQFNAYKDQANLELDKLATLDSRNAYLYQKVKVKENYPIK
ncbi:hypothetical protein DIU31_009375 [Mucilaginibacter rubeus]|uniref:DUF4294 domain-containing protein n=1 Tax=Mucilaginibacter rubeus TaxID=2027860 RepID=A0AAE6JEA4_9SPHI|nr:MULTISPECIES: hypothetical protein [Mucilaginibacter]QEM03713.1 hypothetical protein DIU31_009375 [Mucilaginibacter rubeus]QEM16324.1 hypothetical protein DIU38_009470 [Mucilaginibacter gossypii]QTE40912.1 hypothetical protein J3L19_18295 [Mucilaginibacter rubeus]QTE47515.1 hypothetical protein J3L21_18270 [Mucilaginibacter rubeus]QTE58907.1 hypothetical protein J3L23_09935 [Mucilaginibacter rubeus]